MPTLNPTPATDATPHLATSGVSFRRILLAIDFSQQTPQVLRTALQIASIFHSELYLVNAASPAAYGTGLEATPVETFDVNLQIAQAEMKELVDGEPGLHAFTHHEIVAYNMPLELIREVVEDKQIDLVIAGSHGAHGLERLALGSVAEAILATVDCPVLIVGPHTEPQPNLFARILLAALLKPAGLRSAQYASALAEHFHSELTLLHVIEPRTEHSDLLRERTMKELRELVPANFSAYGRVVSCVEHGKPGDSISATALYMHSTLIVLAARENTALGDHSPWSTMAEIIRRAPCPVLCVRGHLH